MSDFPRIQPIITELLQAGKRYRLLRRNGNFRKNKTGTALKKGESRFKLDYENANQNISAKNYAFYPINGTRRRLSMGKQKVEEYYEPGSGRSDSTFGKVLILDVIECHERKGDGVPTALRPEAKMTALPCYRILNMKSSVWIPYLHGALKTAFETI